VPSDKDNSEYLAFLQQVIAGNYLEEEALLVARQAVDKGPDSLNGKQKKVLEFALKQIAPGRCQNCGDEIAWAEMYQAINSHRCLACAS
jgi:hypothetical protein